MTHSNSWSHEYNHSAVRMFAAIADWHKHSPKLASKIAPTTTVPGNTTATRPGVALIRAKQPLDLVDDNKLEVKGTVVVQGTDLAAKIKSASFHIQCKPSGHDSCVVTTTMTYEPLLGVCLQDDVAAMKAAIGEHGNWYDYDGVLPVGYKLCVGFMPMMGYISISLAADKTIYA